MIIDCHMHLGDILYEDSIDILRCENNYPKAFNIQRFEEDFLLFRSNYLSKKIVELLDDRYTLSVQNRLKAGTYNNFLIYASILQGISKSLYGTNSIACCCMPIAPYVTFDDIKEIQTIDSRILPFNSVDITLSLDEACMELEKRESESYGLKLHPIIQRVKFTSEIYYSSLEIYKGTNKPVLLHAGPSRFYIGEEIERQKCEYDDLFEAKRMISDFPTIPFIIGHCGLENIELWVEEFEGFENVFFEGSVQPPKILRRVFNAVGENRLLFGTDWPAVRTKPMIRTYTKAFNGRQLNKCMYMNALDLLGLDMKNVDELQEAEKAYENKNCVDNWG